MQGVMRFIATIWNPGQKTGSGMGDMHDGGWSVATRLFSSLFLLHLFTRLHLTLFLWLTLMVS